MPTENDIDDGSLVETHVIADMLPAVAVILTAIGVEPPEPRDLLPGEEWVYLRNEPH